MRRVLMAAYHFPPIQGSSGYLRTLKFARYLPEFGYQPIILTVRPSAYPASDARLLGQIPAGLQVERCFALDAARHLSWRGKHLSVLSVPDRFATWVASGLAAGLRLIRRHSVDAVFSTYPVASAHLLGGLLGRCSGLPWVADFRDPMWDGHTRIPPLQLAARKAIERMAFRRAARLVVCTRGMLALYRERYPGLPEGDLENIPNGYDEEDFRDLGEGKRPPGPVRLVHAGLLEPADRDPRPFLAALRRLWDEGAISPERVRVELLAPGHGASAQAVAELRLGEMVSVQPPVPYSQALKRMAEADVLLLFQGPSCDSQVPAKLYEYMRIGKPVLALATATGETGQLVESLGCGRLVRCDDPDAIAAALLSWLDVLAAGGELPRAHPDSASKFSRRQQARTLAGILDAAIKQGKTKKRVLA